MGLINPYPCPICNGTGRCPDSFHSGVNPFADPDENHPSILDSLIGSCKTCGGSNCEWDKCENCDGVGYVDEE